MLQWRGQITRLISTHRLSPKPLVSQSGRSYLIEHALQLDPKGQRDVSLAKSGDQSFVLKTLGPSIFKQAKAVRCGLDGCRFVRLPVDIIEESGIVVYEYRTADLKSFVARRDTLPITQAKLILRDVLQGVKEMHDRDWIHTDLKADNIVIQYTTDGYGQTVIEKVEVADVDNAVFALPGGAIYGTQVGNLFWRSPEAQIGIRIQKPTDVWSFGMLCVYVVMRIVTFNIREEEQKEGMDLVKQVFELMVTYHGPVPWSFLEYIDDNEWCTWLIHLDNRLTLTKGHHQFSRWNKEDWPHPNSSFPDFKRFAGRMLNLDPTQRSTVNELLDDPWWSNADT
ncbi:hypothetical protein MMC13_007035 [Lambiella insularis]|nr:hypothetical protein [Lambiella insularis]